MVDVHALTASNSRDLTVYSADQAANEAASQAIFATYKGMKSANTLRRHAADLTLFTLFLRDAGVAVGDLLNAPAAWRFISWGFVEAFSAWQLKQGYAIASINGRLSTVKVYAGLACKAGVISPEVKIMIASVQGYARKEIRHIDEKRAAD